MTGANEESDPSPELNSPTAPPSPAGKDGAEQAVAARSSEATTIDEPAAHGPLPERMRTDDENTTSEVELLEATPTPMALPLALAAIPTSPAPKRPPPLPPPRRMTPPPPPPPAPPRPARIGVKPSAAAWPGVTSGVSADTVPLPEVGPTRRPETERERLSPELAIADARKRVEQAGAGDRALLARRKTELGLLLEVVAGDATAALAEYRGAHGIAANVPAPLAAARRLTPIRPAAPALALLEAELRATTDAEARLERELELGMLLASSAAPSERTWQCFRQVLARRPGHAGALRGLESALAVAPRTAETQLQIETLAAHLETMAAVFRSDARLSAWIEVERAQLLDKLGRTEAARAALETALALDRGIGPVRDAYTRHLLVHDQVEALVQAWTAEAAMEKDGARVARLLYFAARLTSERLDQKTAAIDLLERAAGQAGVTVAVKRAAWRELWRLYDLAGQREAAVASGTKLLALAHASEAVTFHRRLVDGCVALGRFAEVATHAREVLAAEPDDQAMRESLDHALSVLGQHEQRVVALADQAARASDSGHRIECLLRAAAIAEQEMKKPEAALLSLRSAWAIDPGHPEVTDGIVRLLTPGTPPSPTDADDPSQVRARIDFYVEAAAAAEPPRRIAYLEKLALIWEDEVRDPARALAVYDEILGLEPNRRSAILGLGRAAARAGNASEHLRALRLEADLCGDDVLLERSLLLRAAEIASRQLGDVEGALALIERVLARTGGDQAALRAGFRILERAGRDKEALAKLRQLAGEHHDGDGGYAIHVEMARFLELRMQRPAEALAAWREAHRLNPGNSTARAEIRRLLLAKGDFTLVAEELAGLAAATTDASLRGELLLEAAEIYDDRLGEAERAIPLLGEARVCLPDDETIVQRLDRAYLRAGRRSERLALLLATENADPRSQLTLASLLVEERDPSKGLKRLGDLVAQPMVGVAALRTLEHTLRRSERWSELDLVLRRQVERFQTRESKLGSAYALLALEDYGEVPPPEGEAPAREVLAGLAPGGLLCHELLLKKAGLHPTPGAPTEAVLRALAALAVAASEPLSGAVHQLAAALILDQTAAGEHAAEQEALVAYALAAEGWPDCLTAVRGLRRMALRLGDTRTLIKAATALGGLELEAGRRCERLLEAAHACHALPDLKPMASDLVCRALDQDPTSVHAADAVIAALGEGLDAAKAAETLRAALDRAHSAEQTAKLGAALAHVALRGLRDPTVALEGLRRARKRAPKHVGNLLALADVSMALGLYAEAVEAATAAQAISREPRERVRAAVTLAEVHACTPAFKETARREALEAEQLAQQSGGANGELYARLGRVLRKLDDLESAERILVEAALLGPDSRALDDLCTLFGEDRAGAERAAAALDKVMALAQAGGHAVRPIWLATLGRLEMAMLAKPARGLARVREAIAMAPTQVELYAALAQGMGSAHDETLRELGALLPGFGQAQPNRSEARAMLALLGGLYREAGRAAPAAVTEELMGLLDGSGQQSQPMAALPAAAPAALVLTRQILVTGLFDAGAPADWVEVAALLSPSVQKWIRQDPEAFAASAGQRLPAHAPHPVRVLAERIARAFGELAFDLYVEVPATEIGRVLAGDPPVLLLPPRFATGTEVEQAAELARLLTYVALGIAWVAEATPENLDGILLGALRTGSESWGHGQLSPAADMNVGMWRPRLKGVGRRIKRSLEEAAQRIRPQSDTSTWRQAMRAASLRAGYVLSGDLTASLSQVGHIDRDLGKDSRALEERLFAHPLARDLVMFALSDAAAVLRHSAGTASA